MLPYKGSYLISKDKLLVIKKYINKHLNKGFIYFSISLAATPIFLTKSQKEVSDFILTIEDLTLL
jgi:hypothetical protein